MSLRGHPPLFFPWADLFTTQAGDGPVGFTEIRFRQVASPRFIVSVDTLRRLDEAAGHPWRNA